ncbi:MAG TPA: heparinase II/III family protein [Bacteroidota bacterium]|nr:heparinase II/III family protein [Bacteroidota bacterium]
MRLTAPLILLLWLPAWASAQRTFTPPSRLADSDYVAAHIHEVSDEDLWSSIDTAREGLAELRAVLRRGDRAAAAGAWEAYRRATGGPVYITRTDHLLLDTDRLTDTAAFRAELDAAPEERDSILARADEMLRNVIRPWGDVVLSFGDRVDFNREVGQSGKYGFHYWMWSRPLLMAYVLTRKDAYLRKFDELFNRWYEQRNSISGSIPKFDVVYYELGLGMRNRMFIEDLLLRWKGRSPETDVRILKTALAAGRWLGELERWEGYRAGNWQVHGAYMLVQIALVFPELRESAAWLATGLDRLQSHLREDFYADGGHSERSPRNYTLATYLNYRNLAYLLGVYGRAPEVRGEIRASLGRTIDWWLAMITPTGEIPAINDSQRGLFPVAVLRDGARLFDKPDALGVLRNIFGERTGGSAVLPPFTSRHMPASGFTVMRSDWTPRALYCSINYGPEAGFHTHRDMLDVELYAYGRPLAVDAGLGLTYDDTLYETWYRSSRAHNMVTVNDSSIEREGTVGEDVHWGSTPLLDFFSGTHRGYRRFGVTIRRQIAFIKPFYWFFLDDAACEHGGDTLSWYLHTPVGLVKNGGDFRTPTGPGFALIPAARPYAVRRGTGWGATPLAKRPGTTVEIPWIRFDQRSVSGETPPFAFLISPFQAPGAHVPAVERVSRSHFTVRRAHGTDDLYFAGGKFDDGRMKTDAAFVLIHREKGARSLFSVVDATFLVSSGDTLLSSSVPATRQWAR